MCLKAYVYLQMCVCVGGDVHMCVCVGGEEEEWLDQRLAGVREACI